MSNDFKVQFPDLFDEGPTNNLCIIGNGFDMHHCLDTSFSDFRNFLVKNGDGDYVLQLESYFQSDYIDDNGIRKFLLWSNLEKAIGQYDLEELYHELTDWIDIDYDHMMRSAAQIEDAPNDFLAPLLESLPSRIEEWISSIDLYRVEADVEFPEPSRFLTFNYTRVLEDVYHIPEDDVLHIHGAIGADELVVGHKVKAKESDAYDESTPIYQEDSKINIINIMNACRKPTENIIARNQSFFQTLNDITDIYVYGHSYSPVDLDYFEEVRKNVSDATKWHLGCYNGADRKAAEEMMAVLNVPNDCWGRFKF